MSTIPTIDFQKTVILLEHVEDIYLEKPEEIAEMVLQEELNQMLRQGQRECLHLKGLIRKLKSAQALLQMRKDEAKKDLEGYVNKLSESLIEFRSEMHVSIRTEVEHKNSKLTSLREKYEADIQSYTELCDAAEKLMYFGKSLNSESDRCKAKELLLEFSKLMQMTTGKDEIGAVVKFEFYPALPVDSIVPSMFGDLVIGSSVKPKVLPLSVLAARKSKCDNDENSSTNLDNKSLKQAVDVVKIDQYTQTDKIEKEASSADGSEKVASNQESLGYKIMQCDQQYASYPMTSPSGFEQVAMPYRTPVSYSNLNPPPGFPVYQRHVAPQSYQVAGVPQQGLQVNPYMLTNNPTYQGSRINQWYTTLATPANNCQNQNAYLCECTQSVSPESACYHPSQKWYTGVPLVNRSYISPISSPCLETQVGNLSNDSNRTVESDNVRNIPLPLGPMPKENSLHYNNKMSNEVVQRSASALNSDKKLNFESSEKQNPDKNRKDIILTEIETNKEVNREENLSETKGSPSDIQRFEDLLNRTNELLEASHLDEFSETNRKDEALESHIGMKNVDKSTDITQIENVQKVIINSIKDECNKNENIHEVEVDGISSKTCEDLKLKMERDDEMTSTVKPLRRPLRLPKICLSQTKARSESLSDSSPSEDSGYIATENINANASTIETICPITTKLTTEQTLSDQTETECPFNDKMVIKQEIADHSESKNDEKQPVINVLGCSSIKNEEISEVGIEPDLLDLNLSTGANLRDVVKSKGPSKSEIKEMNKITLQSQTKWLKGYLQQVLPENKEKNDKVKKADENNNCSDESWKNKSEIYPESDNLNVDNITSSVVKDGNNNVYTDSVQNEIGSKKLEIKLEGDTTKTTQTDKENCEPSKSNVTDRKTDIRNLKSAVKGFLGGRREASQRSTSTYSRLGALQAHWLKNSRGTDIKAKYLFSCSENMRFPIGVTTNSLQQIIVADTGNHCVKMFDPSGKFMRVLRGLDMRRPSAVVVNEFDHIFVKDDISIKVFDNLGDSRMNIDTEFNKPFGLVLTPAKYLLVLDADRRHPALVHVSQDGDDVLRFPYTPLINAPPGSKCRFMAVSENNVLVSDLGLSQIYISDFQGLFIKVIGSPGFEPQQFHEPSGISVDNYGNIVIGDSRNNRVQVYRHDGSFTGLIDFDEKIVRPSDIHLTSDNKLLVVNFINHNIKVYQLLA